MFRRLIGISAAMTFLACWFAWGLMFAYADWLRFSSPRAPDPTTGQIVYMKAVKGVFYITAQQDRLVGQHALWSVWLIGAVAMLVLWLTGERVDGERGRYSPWPEGRVGQALNALIIYPVFAGWLALFFFGDHIMALVFTGSLSLPSNP